MRVWVRVRVRMTEQKRARQRGQIAGRALRVGARSGRRATSGYETQQFNKLKMGASILNAGGAVKGVRERTLDLWKITCGSLWGGLAAEAVLANTHSLA